MDQVTFIVDVGDHEEQSLIATKKNNVDYVKETVIRKWITVYDTSVIIEVNYHEEQLFIETKPDSADRI